MWISHHSLYSGVNSMKSVWIAGNLLTLKLTLQILPVILKMGTKVCTVNLCYVLAERFILFAVRLPSLFWAKWTVGLWHSFWYFFTHVLHGSFLLLFYFFFFQNRKYFYFSYGCSSQFYVTRAVYVTKCSF